MTTDRDNSELLLTAFRYVAGELSTDEATAFETALSDDQSARDALADAVVLSEAVAVEEFDRIRPQRLDTVPPSRRTFMKWGTLTAVCIVAVSGYIVLHSPPETTGPTGIAQPAEPLPLPVSGDAHAVLSLWSELGQNSDLFGSDASVAEDAETTPVPNEIPDWMLMAVVGADETTADMPDEMRELMDELDRENL